MTAFDVRFTDATPKAPKTKFTTSLFIKAPKPLLPASARWSIKLKSAPKGYSVSQQASELGII